MKIHQGAAALAAAFALSACEQPRLTPYCVLYEKDGQPQVADILDPNTGKATYRAVNLQSDGEGGYITEETSVTTDTFTVNGDRQICTVKPFMSSLYPPRSYQVHEALQID